MNKAIKSLLKQNNRRSKIIFDENQEVYTNMILYLRGSNLSFYNQEVVRADIIELILDGQERGDNIGAVMGGNYKAICDEIVEAMPNKTKKEGTAEIAGILLNVAWFFSTIKIIETLLTRVINKQPGLNYILTIGEIYSWLLAGVFSILIVRYITRKAFVEGQRSKKFTFLRDWLFLTIVLSIMLMFRLVFKKIILEIPLVMGLGITIIIFIISRFVNAMET